MKNETFENGPVCKVYFKFALTAAFSMMISLVYYTTW